MRRYLEKMAQQPKDKKLSEMEKVRRAVYLTRIEKRINRELENLYWLCKNYPDVFLYSYRNQTGKQHERLKKLLLCIKALNPKCDIFLVLKNLKDEPEQPKKIKLINGEEYELKDGEISIPHRFEIPLEGLKIVKEETFSIPLEPLSISKKEVIKLPLTVKELKKKE